MNQLLYSSEVKKGSVKVLSLDKSIVSFESREDEAPAGLLVVNRNMALGLKRLKFG
jgi:hypothetical protein